MAETAAPRRTQGDRTVQTRRVLIEAATGLLAEQGFGLATTSAIAERAQVTTGALHHHFGSKGALLLAVLEASNERILVQVASLSNAAGPDGMARRLVGQLWKAYGDERYWAVWEIILGQRHDPALRKKLLAHRTASFERVFTATLAALGIAPSAAPALRDGFAFTLHAMRGLLLERLLARDAAVPRQLDLLTDVLDNHLRAARRADPGLAGGTALGTVKEEARP